MRASDQSPVSALRKTHRSCAHRRRKWRTTCGPQLAPTRGTRYQEREAAKSELERCHRHLSTAYTGASRTRQTGICTSGAKRAAKEAVAERAFKSQCPRQRENRDFNLYVRVWGPILFHYDLVVSATCECLESELTFLVHKHGLTYVEADCPYAQYAHRVAFMKNVHGPCERAETPHVLRAARVHGKQRREALHE